MMAHHALADPLNTVAGIQQKRKHHRQHPNWMAGGICECLHQHRLRCLHHHHLRHLPHQVGHGLPQHQHGLPQHQPGHCQRHRQTPCRRHRPDDAVAAAAAAAAAAATAAAAAAAAEAEEQRVKRGAEILAEAQPEPAGSSTAKISLKLSSGERMQRVFRADQELREVYEWAHCCRPVAKPLRFQLCTSFPAKALSDRSASLRDMGLTPSAVVILKEDLEAED
mmetsp:Transcript_30299/g.56044  ORF Transcript_30299/g.56044 Transcript_30299/m.56044 type:complete len:223 (+) Transcript_30299:1755-2423(+)